MLIQVAVMEALALATAAIRDQFRVFGCGRVIVAHQRSVFLGSPVFSTTYDHRKLTSVFGEHGFKFFELSV